MLPQPLCYFVLAELLLAPQDDLPLVIGCQGCAFLAHRSQSQPRSNVIVTNEVGRCK